MSKELSDEAKQALADAGIPLNQGEERGFFSILVGFAWMIIVLFGSLALAWWVVEKFIQVVFG